MSDKFYIQRVIVSSKMLGYPDEEIKRMIDSSKDVDTQKLKKKEWYKQLERCYGGFDKKTLEKVRTHALCMDP